MNQQEARTSGYIDDQGELTDEGNKALAEFILGDLVAVDASEPISGDKGLDLIDGFVSRAVTLLFGESMAGKTFLAANIIASLHDGRDVLGFTPNDTKIRSLIVATDTQARNEYHDRLTKQSIGSGVATVIEIPTHPSVEVWDKIVEYAGLEDIGFLVVDHASTALGEEGRNDEREWNRLFDQLERFVRIGIPVLLIGHASDSRNFGRPSYKPMGSATVTQRSRARIGVCNQSGKYSNKNRTIRTDSNTRGAEEVRAVLDPDSAVFHLRDPESAKTKQAVRSSERFDTNAEIIKAALNAPRGLNQNQTLEHIANQDTVRSIDGEPLSPRTLRNKVSSMGTLVWDRSSRRYVEITKE